MRELALLAAVALSAVTISSAAQAQITVPTDTPLVTFSGNPCGAAGGINSCVATQTGVINGTSTDPLASSLVARINTPGSTDISTLFNSTITGSEFSWSITNNVLTFTYTAGAGDPVLHYLGLFQGGCPAGGTNPCPNGTYDLFYDAGGFTSASINLSSLFLNQGLSHIDVFDTTTPGGVPEPGTWALMLLGFGAAGVAIRRSRRKALLAQIA